MYRGLALALVTALTASLCQVVSAQQPSGIARLGFLGPPPLARSLLNAVATLGYAEGRTVMIDSRWPQGDRLDLMTESATELLKLKVDVLVVVGATAARAAKSVTPDVPIVFEVVVVPEATGLVVNVEASSK